MTWSDGTWWSNDGLRLHYRDYPGRDDRPPVLCLPGLTRNARDFEGVAERLAGNWRVICPSFRGRGDSAYAKDPLSYVPLTYVQDIERLLQELGVRRFVAIGTSLGGIVAMLLAAGGTQRLAAIVLNDIGPTIEAAGLSRIRGYVGKSAAYPTWVHAARATADNNKAVYPDYRLADWIAMAKRLYRLTGAGRVVPDYDMRIAEPFRLPGGEAGVDLWPAFSALADVPALFVRGERSDVLSDATLAHMLAQARQAQAVVVPRVGHAPTLEEPIVAQAIDMLLERAK